MGLLPRRVRPIHRRSCLRSKEKKEALGVLVLALHSGNVLLSHLMVGICWSCIIPLVFWICLLIDGGTTHDRLMV